MKHLIIIILILIMGSLQAADVLQSSLNVGVGVNTNLGSPRDHVWAMLRAGEIGWMRFRSGYTNILLSTDYGVSESNSFTISPTTLLNYHAHTWARGDTLYHVPNVIASLDDMRIYRYSLLTGISLIDYTSLDWTGADDIIGSVAHYQDNGSGMVAAMRESGGSGYSGYYATSTNNGQTWTASTGKILSIATNHDSRMGVFPTGGDSALAIYYDFGTGYRAVHCYAYDATGLSWNVVGNDPIDVSTTMPYVRDFDAVVGVDGTIHICISDTATVSRIHHYYKRTTDATWQHAVIFTSSMREMDTGNRGIRIGLGVSESDGRVRLLFGSSTETGAVDSRRLYLTHWVPGTLSWTTPVRMGTDETITEITVANRVPATHESRMYALTANGTTTWVVRLLQIYDAAQGIEANAQVLITSLPYRITEAMHSAAYLAGTKTKDTVALQGITLTSVDSGLYFHNTDNWDLIGQGDTLKFACVDAATTLTGAWGILCRNSDNIYIKDLNIVEGVTGIDTTQYLVTDAGVHDNGAFYGGSGSLIDSLDGCYLEVSSYNSHVFEVWNVPGFYVYNCNVKSNVWAYDSRCQFDGAAIFMTHYATATRVASGAAYDFLFKNTNVLRTPHVGLLGEPLDSGIFQMDNCNIFVDAENWRYTAYSGTCCGKANCYGIQYTNADNGSYIKKCTVLAGEQNTGGRGIHLVSSNGLESGAWGNPVVLCSNYVNVHESGDIEFYDTNLVSQQEYFPCAIKVRQLNYGVDIYDNQFIYVADGQASWSAFAGNSYYPRGEAGMYQLWDSGTDPTPCYIRWRNNLFRTTDRTSGAFNTAFVWEHINYLDHTLLFYNNRLESDSVLVRLGGRDTNFGVLVDSMVACTLKSLDPNNHVTGYIHGWRALDGGYFNAQTIGFTVKDMVYLSYTDTPLNIDTSIYFPGNSRLQDQKDLVTMEVTVVDSTDTPIPGANILIVNNYFTSLFSGLTNSLGKASKIVTYWYESRTGPDSMLFNNFQVTVSYAGLSADSTFTVKHNQKDFTVRLGTASQPIVRKHFHGIHK